ncbi:unnamed protein product [Rhizophagus irregularis]|nr:unnamed protein product [Rhizophagus irregularis]
MIRPPNDESEVVKSSLLDIPEPKVQIFDNTNSETSQAELELVEKLLEEASIEGFDLSFPLDDSLTSFSLNETPLKERKPSIKLAPSGTALSREKNLPAPVRLEQSRISNPNDHFVWWDLICMCTSEENTNMDTKA